MCYMTLRGSENELYSKWLEVLGPNLGWDTGHPQVLHGFLGHSGKFRGSTLIRL
jgi:hypothetical protein